MSIANTLERQMLDLVNDERTERGLSPLSLERNLNTSSEDHSSWMLQSDTFSHTGANGSSATDRMRDADFTFSGSWASGENLAWQSERGAPGLADDVIDLHESLMNSPGHRANILNPNFEVIGIGIEQGDFKGWDTVMVTQNFARTGAAVDLDEGASEPAPAPEPEPAPAPTPAPAAEDTPSEPQADPEPTRPQPDPAPAEPQPDPAPVAENAAPVIEVEDITLARARGARSTRLEDHLQVEDDDGDDIAWFELLDTEGRDNFRFRGEGRIDAETPYRIDADDLDMIRIRLDSREGESTLSIRASDGESVGDWQSFILHTVDPDEMIFV
ncbi:CAP domain-containing protein [Limimaricola sp.]|uniref:CAP domain-containing protein n=1 Tax=Limimaricola sp. TaxID=2211665 RepID=UPI00405983B4